MLLCIAGIRISTFQGSDLVNSHQRTLKCFLRPLDRPSADKVAVVKADSTDILDTDHKELPCHIYRPPSDTAACPLCGTQVAADNTVFNQHIDECLNMSAIKEATGVLQRANKLQSSQKSSRKRAQSCLRFINHDEKKKKHTDIL